MAATNRTDKIKQLFKVLQKRYKHFPKPAERKLLEHLVFAACLENASFDATGSAYSVLEHHYIDWNELRVSTSQEIADTLPMLPKPLEAGERIKKTLQWVFETSYMFDLEEYHKKTIGQMIEYLDSIPSCTPFMINYVVQIGLGGHQIPFDEAAMRIMRRLDLTKVSEGKEEVSGIERVITKSQGVEFGTLMHMFGIEFYEKQDSPELLTLLKSIDANAGKRSWQEPEGLVKKPDQKLVPVRPVSLIPKKFKPEIELEDDDIEAVDITSGDDSIEFIDHGLASLANTSKESTSGDDSRTGAKKEKKTTEKSLEKLPPKKIEETVTPPIVATKTTAAPVAKQERSATKKPATVETSRVTDTEKTPVKQAPKKPEPVKEKESAKPEPVKSKGNNTSKSVPESKSEKPKPAAKPSLSAKQPVIPPVKESAPAKSASQKSPATKPAPAKNNTEKKEPQKTDSKSSKKTTSNTPPPKKDIKKTTNQAAKPKPADNTSHAKKLQQKKPR